MATSTQSVSAFAITTTFTAPTACAQSVGGLTMLQDDQFRIWLNHPLPVPGTTITSCYPDEFASSFLLQTGGVSQAAFSPLVCPAGYTTQGPYTSNYIACCPSGWDGLAVASNAPSDRPAFGGTCFSNIFNVPIRITSYDTESIKASSIFTATNSQAQAFAFPYEGFALGVAVVASTTPTGSSTATGTSTTSSATASSDSSNSSQIETTSSKSNTGAVAGAIIGSILAALFLTGGVYLMINYRRKRMSGQNQDGQFPDYASHLRLQNASPTPMVYLSQPPQVMTEYYKANDRGQVNRYDGQKYHEMHAHKPVVYEMDGATRLPITKTKQLPDLPPNRSP
ncbi:uncharacterized protein PAC_16251 [Phialocephala subalpina]|uniref:Uncharacterized protein n=1 Tax=Phialocephala subalpina TaxID=576137 RepID=A0A1L7XMR6_9HELO|nr:uncharacterized protein PAC_16251 [Phialocephala subalpina]